MTVDPGAARLGRWRNLYGRWQGDRRWRSKSVAVGRARSRLIGAGLRWKLFAVLETLAFALLPRLHQHRAELGGIHRLFKDRALDSERPAALNHMVLVVVVGGHEDHRHVRNLLFDLEVKLVA